MSYMPLLYSILTMIVCIIAMVAVFFRFTVPGYMPSDDLIELGEWDDENAPLNEYAAEYDRRDQITGSNHATKGRHHANR